MKAKRGCRCRFSPLPLPFAAAGDLQQFKSRRGHRSHQFVFPYVHRTASRPGQRKVMQISFKLRYDTRGAWPAARLGWDGMMGSRSNAVVGWV
jgi:hypothetical protein